MRATNKASKLARAQARGRVTGGLFGEGQGAYPVASS